MIVFTYQLGFFCETYFKVDPFFYKAYMYVCCVIKQPSVVLFMEASSISLHIEVLQDIRK